MSDVCHLPDPADRDLRCHAGLEVLEPHFHPGRGRRGHIGGDEPRGHCVRGDAERAELDGQGLGEALQPGLGPAFRVIRRA